MQERCYESGSCVQKNCASLGGHPTPNSLIWVQLESKCRLGPKSSTKTQSKAKRTNRIDYRSRLCKQGVAGSSSVTSTIFLPPFFFLTRCFVDGALRHTTGSAF